MDKVKVLVSCMSYDGGQYLRKINYPNKKMLSTEENEVRLGSTNTVKCTVPSTRHKP